MKKSSKTTPSSTVKRSNVGGIIFVPKNNVEYYRGVQAWVEAKCPDNCLVLDMWDTLHYCGIPIVDCMKVATGMFVRLPKRRAVKPSTIRIYNRCKNIEYKIVNKVEGQVLFSNPNVKKNTLSR